jgi:hypothetical protein
MTGRSPSELKLTYICRYVGSMPRPLRELMQTSYWDKICRTYAYWTQEAFCHATNLVDILISIILVALNYMNKNATQKQKDDHCYTYNSKTIFFSYSSAKIWTNGKGHCSSLLCKIFAQLRTSQKCRSITTKRGRSKCSTAWAWNVKTKEKSGMEHPNFYIPDSSVLKFKNRIKDEEGSKIKGSISQVTYGSRDWQRSSRAPAAAYAGASGDSLGEEWIETEEQVGEFMRSVDQAKQAVAEKEKGRWREEEVGGGSRVAAS